MQKPSGSKHPCTRTGADWARKIFASGIVLFLLSSGISGCFGGCLTGLANGQQQAQSLVAEMHQKMANGDLTGIYDGADKGYKDAMTRQKSDALFSAIGRKLGAPQDCKQQGFNIYVTTSGTTLRLVCQTAFSKNATGMETFVWIKSGEQFRLLSYYINSQELIER